MSITIPPAALEAAVNAYAGAIWDADARPIDHRHAMTAAIAAALAAWPGVTTTSWFQDDSFKAALNFPLNTENSSD